ncbi:MAG TPA: HepT-like ribonuclease domain-containing protein [Phycisphaerales bacterium]|nr:HepT-like ribonuclease domain-containing protein [Phycisphaerales bacterium]
MIALIHEAIAEFAPVTEEQFLSRRLFQTSAAWYIQAVGEAAARVSDESRSVFPSIPWNQVVGMRNILSHEYDQLMPAKLWRVLRVHFGTMLQELEANVDKLPWPKST